MVEERHTPNNPSFTGYCAEFRDGDILLAVAPMASIAADALRDALKPRLFTTESQDRDGNWVVRENA